MDNEKMQRNDEKPNSSEVCRVVTLKLPEKTVQLLETFNQDLTRAIADLTDSAVQRAFPKGSSYEVVRVAPHTSVLIVGSNTLLSRIPWIKLVEIAPGRNLIAIPSGTSLESLEIAILELIEGIASTDETEKSLLKEFCKYVGRLRRYNRISRAEIMIVDTDF